MNDSEHFKELQKYDLEEVFWKHCHKTFSFVNETPSLEKLVISLFITYAEREIDGKLPSSLNRYILNKAGTVMAFMDQLKIILHIGKPLILYLKWFTEKLTGIRCLKALM